MALIRKKNPEWFPSENKGLLVGETVDIGDFRRLVESGMADLVDEQGNVLPLPGTVFVCVICFEGINNHAAYVAHIMSQHGSLAKQQDILEEEEETPKPKEKEVNGVIIPESFGEKMKKARAAAKAKREAEKIAAETK